MNYLDFRRESKVCGEPASLWAYLPGAFYRRRMVILHALGRHAYRTRPLGGRHCDWCGSNAGTGQRQDSIRIPGGEG